MSQLVLLLLWAMLLLLWGHRVSLREGNLARMRLGSLVGALSSISWIMMLSSFSDPACCALLPPKIQYLVPAPTNTVRPR